MNISRHNKYCMIQPTHVSHSPRRFLTKNSHLTMTADVLSQDLVHFVRMVSAATSLIIITPLFIVYLKQYYCCNNRYYKLYNIYKHNTFCIFFFIILFNITNVTEYIIVLYDIYIYMYFQKTVAMSFLLTILSMYTLILSRLYFTFRDSIYVLSNCIIYSHTINIILIFVLYALGYFGFDSDIDNEQRVSCIHPSINK